LANIRLIGRRIKGVKSTSKITRAMEMIAASKMRKAQESGIAGRPYAEKITQVLSALAALPEESGELHPCLICRKPVNRITLIHITPDRGLAGGLVSNINRKTAAFILEKKVPTNVIALGRKGLDFVRRTRQNITAEFTGMGDRPTLIDTLPISHIIIDDYSNAATDEVYLAYTQFVNTMVQKPVIAGQDHFRYHYQ